MFPVLAVRDPIKARKALIANFGWVEDGKLMRLGEQAILVSGIGEFPKHFMALPLDHVALDVSDADSAYRTFSARGATLSKRYTPNGPRDIPEFWEHGVRFVFFEAPEGWPLEFCAENGRRMRNNSFGHSHYGIRCQSVENLERDLVSRGASRISEYSLGSGPDIVTVVFLRFGTAILELFDEPPFAVDHNEGWIGLAKP